MKHILKALRAKLLSPLSDQLMEILESQRRVEYKVRQLQNSIGRVEFRQLGDTLDNGITDYEYQVYSQWGEDGIIQFLTKNIPIKNHVFVEFGVESYEQSNTRFLLINNNWSGLIIDSSQENISKIKNSEIYWNYNLKAICSFISKRNINNILLENGLSGEIGLLSIDIDGNDYWIWEEINVINPAIVIIEYNYRFGKDAAVTIPYKEQFERQKAHYSMIYFGASLKALCLLAKQKGYSFVGCGSSGVNAFFVRSDKVNPNIKEITIEQGYKAGKFCEARNIDGRQTKMTPEEEIQLLQNLDLPLIDLS
jgi:hypothetical protein